MRTVTLTLKIDPTLEQRLREEAARRGINPDSYAVAAIEERVRLDSRQSAPLNHTESGLLSQINKGLPEETWSRYERLIDKRRANALTPEEHAELLRLTNAVEEDHARGVELLVKLASLRNIPLETLMFQRMIGIPPTPPKLHTSSNKRTENPRRRCAFGSAVPAAWGPFGAATSVEA